MEFAACAAGAKLKIEVGGGGWAILDNDAFVIGDACRGGGDAKTANGSDGGGCAD